MCTNVQRTFAGRIELNVETGRAKTEFFNHLGNVLLLSESRVRKSVNIKLVTTMTATEWTCERK